MSALRSVLLFIGLLLSTGLAAMERVTPCQVAQLDLSDRLWVLEDTDGSLSAAQVAALPESRFTPVDERWLPPAYSRSAFWLRFALHNPDAASCSRSLTVGGPSLEDIQVHVRRGDHWTEMRAGSAHALEHWPQISRPPVFPLPLAAGETVDVLVRVASVNTLVAAPQLWAGPALLERTARVQLVEGISLGIVLLIAPFSLVVGLLMGSRLLMVHAGAVLFYICTTSVVNGYLIYLPGALPWSRELQALFSCLSMAFVLGYCRILLQVSRLPQVFGWLFGLILAVHIGCYLWLVLVDPLQARLAMRVNFMAFYFILPLALVVGLLRRLSFSWLAWVVVCGYSLQFLARYVLNLDQLPFQSRASAYSLASTLPGVALLVCTLILEFSRSRSGERRALADLDRLKEAEHERLESTVARRTAQLRESLRARSLLMARISHDLRSPLVGIIHHARLLQAGSDQEPSRKIERNARQQLELIDELLEFSRSELEQLELTLAPGYLYGFLHELREEGEFLAARGGNRLECRFSRDLPALVQADFRRLRQVLINLLGNAAKFTSNGQIVFEVSCRSGAEPDGVELTFTVSDTGIGIDPAEREHLLQPFRRGHNAERFDGKGLGLSIVSQLLERMDSQLEVESPSEGGSRFGFHLQLASAREQDLEAGIRESHAMAVDGCGRRILVADDVEQNLEALGDLLGGYGFEVVTAAGGEEALAQLREQSVDLLITDQMMPGMDGWALLGQVRAGWPKLPVMLYSAAPALQPDAMPFDAVLLKPASSGELLALIDDLTAARTGRPPLHYTEGS